MVVAQVGLGLVQPPGVEAGVLQGVAGVAEAGEVVPRHVAARHARVGPVREPVEPVLRRIALHSTASLSAVFRSQKRTKLLHTSGACPGDGSYYY